MEVSFFVALFQVYLLDAVTSSGNLKAKQKLGVTFNFDEQDVIDLKQIQKNSRTSFVFLAKNYKGLVFFISKLKEI